MKICGRQVIFHSMTQNSDYRSLGQSDLHVCALGLGCMGMSFAYGPADESESLAVMRRYFELGGNFLDTAEIYGPFTNEELLGKFLREIPRETAVIATKFGFKFENGSRSPDSSPANVRRACDASLKRLGIKVIDLFYQHRVDPMVPIEETVGAMGELVKQGKVRALGLSEAGPETLRRAAKIHPITALQSEYSLWTRDVESNGVLATCRELGITFVAYSPLGRGFLTGAIQKLDDLDPNPRDPFVLQEQGFGDMVGDALDEREMHAFGQRAGRGMFQIEIVFRCAQRRIGRESRRAIDIDRYRDAQRLRQMRFFGIEAGEHRHLEIMHFQRETVVQARPFHCWRAP